MVVFTLQSIAVRKVLETVASLFKYALFLQAGGRMINAMARELIVILMVMCMKENGTITQDMEKESTNALQLNSKFVIQLLKKKLTMIMLLR